MYTLSPETTGAEGNAPPCAMVVSPHISTVQSHLPVVLSRAKSTFTFLALAPCKPIVTKSWLPTSTGRDCR
jgi:hypothetical protein